MTYLVAKMVVLLVVAAALGFGLGRWWVRRRFVDVTDEYEKLISAGPLKDYTPALDVIQTEMKDGHAQLSNHIRSIEGRLRDLVAAEIARARAAEAPSAELVRIENGVAELARLSRDGSTATIDLGPVEVGLTQLQRDVQALGAASPATLDLAPFEGRLSALEAAIRSLPGVSGPCDLDPVIARLNQVERTMDATSRPGVDLAPLLIRLDGLERAVKDALPRGSPPPPPQEGPPLFKSATFGPKDDLKRISGVGAVLERLLNDLGVYYFFQIASWSPADVKHVDDRLASFKGRIERDNWIDQAKKLARTSSAKPPPGLADASFGLEPGDEYPVSSDHASAH